MKRTHRDTAVLLADNDDPRAAVFAILAVADAIDRLVDRLELEDNA